MWGEPGRCKFEKTNLTSAVLRDVNLLDAIFCNNGMPDGSINNCRCKHLQADTSKVNKLLIGKAANKNLDGNQ